MHHICNYCFCIQFLTNVLGNFYIYAWKLREISCMIQVVTKSVKLVCVYLSQNIFLNKYKLYNFLTIVLSSAEALLQSRPLPQIPDISDDLRSLPPPLDGASRWMSKDNLLSQDDSDSALFVALYDFQSGGENQLSLRKGILIFHYYLFHSSCILLDITGFHPNWKVMKMSIY